MIRQMRRWIVAAMLATSFTAAGSVQAQIWTPTYMAPRSSSDFGIYLSDGPGDLAVEGIWRRGAGGYDLGLRVGVADTEDLSLLVGGELRSPLAVGAAPLDLALTAGIQGLLGDAEALGAQLGLTLGHTFVPGAFTLTPYIHPRIGVVSGLGRRDDADLDLLADLGIDFGFSPNLLLRIGIPFEQPGSGLGIGLAWR